MDGSTVTASCSNRSFPFAAPAPTSSSPTLPRTPPACWLDHVPLLLLCIPRAALPAFVIPSAVEGQGRCFSCSAIPSGVEGHRLCSFVTPRTCGPAATRTCFPPLPLRTARPRRFRLSLGPVVESIVLISHLYLFSQWSPLC